MKHLKASHSFKFPLSKYNTIPVQFLPRKIQREDWWHEMVRVHNLVNVSFISPMKYQASCVSKLLLGFNPSKQREFESCISTRWLQELLQGDRTCCPALGAAAGPLGAGTVIRAQWTWGLSVSPARGCPVETEDKGHLLHDSLHSFQLCQPMCERWAMTPRADLDLPYWYPPAKNQRGKEGKPLISAASCACGFKKAVRCTEDGCCTTLNGPEIFLLGLPGSVVSLGVNFFLFPSFASPFKLSIPLHTSCLSSGICTEPKTRGPECLSVPSQHHHPDLQWGWAATL